MECWSCKSNAGEKRISPGPTILEGKYWLVEHAYPIKMIDWLVKEYISCYAEMEQFRHIHFHVFAKPPDLPKEPKGGNSFALLKVTPEEAVPPGKIIEFCELLKNRLTSGSEP